MTAIVPSALSVREGAPDPLGATWDGGGVNFAIFSANATKVEVCLFDADGQREIERIALPEYTDEIWHGYVAGLEPGALYGYRVYGPYAPERGHRFNPNKLLLDPYALGHSGELRWDDACFGYTIGAKGDDLTFDERDSAPFVPKCVVVDRNFDWASERRWRRVPWDRTIVYELHVKGYTKRHGAIDERLRGTYRGLASEEVTSYIRSLGVTSVELLPIQTFVDDAPLLDRGLRNYWGYNSIGFFAPDARYAAEPRRAAQEFKEMVARFHDAGLEVILDVVYNHTAEGNERGPTLSFKGIDNASYYRLMPDQPRYYINDTGTGNTFNVANRRVLQLVTDSLRHWVTEMHVDGFRFDLGTILAREATGFNREGPFLAACGQDPVLRGVKLIAEPWDIGPGGYQVGCFPPGWAEWNDKFRDTVRDFWRGEASAAALAPRITGSGDTYDRLGRKPWASVNFITAHDGFTLNDLVSYDEKHNEANGENNQDGSSDNRSWNCGAEGPTDDANVRALRERQMRNLLATLLLSQGTPMLQAGDEFARTQDGNNNAYCQDDEITWIDWDKANGPFERSLTAFVKRLTALRHRYPILHHTRFLAGTLDPDLGVKDVTWINADGSEMHNDEWSDAGMHCFGMVLDGRARPSGIRKRGKEITLLIVYNAHHDLVQFTLPEVAEGLCWQRVADTNIPDDDDIATFAFGAVYDVTAFSLLAFALEATG